MPRSEHSSPPPVEWARYAGPLRTLVMFNALLAFTLELAMFAFVGWWALALDLAWWVRIPIAVAAVGALIAVWGAFASPRARFLLPTAGVVAVKAAAFGSGALALWALGYPAAAVAFAVLAAANTTATTYVRTRPAK
ncbi:YrdB family protein [Glycomyces niveus]|uniref:YrdB family protein n=1 Tax=Glycomyces niveus TaxID=2820287 RepID=A0ABS3TYZ6_9ACTN|nr:YrdB family protein [Glycomyces sp. NEAU-S30]MBO3731441.1 YrdB family protein [Glycomyces sp. NEAU-S30]